MSPRFSLLLSLSLLSSLLSTGCIYVIPAVVAGAVVGTQSGKSGRNVILVDQEADLLFARGPADTGSTPEGKGRTVVGLQLRVTATKATRLDSLRFRISGSGNDKTLTSVSLYEDKNSDARLDPGERRLATSTLFSADEGDALFTGLAEPLAAGQSLDLLLVFDVPLDALDNQTHQVRVEKVNDVSAVTTLASGETRAVEVLGLPIQGGVKTISASGSLLLRVGPSAPASRTIFPNAQSVVMGQLELRTSSVEAIDVSALTVTQAGSGQLQAQIARGDLYQDVNGDGLLDAGDVAIALNVVPTQNQLQFSNLAQVIPASGIVQWLVVYTFNGAAPDGASFRPDLAQGSVTARGTSSAQSIAPTGLPLTSTTTTSIQRATLNVLAGPFPGGGQASPGQSSVSVLQLQLTAGPAEPVVLTSLRITGSGSGNEASDLSSARLFLDQNGDGAIAGDPQIGQVLVYPADNGSITFSGFQREIAAGATQFWVVVYDVGGSAGAGVDFRATANPAADFGASGRTSALAITPNGGAVTGGRLDVTGSLSLAAGPVAPPPASVLANDLNVPVLQLRLSAGVGEAIRLTSLTVRPSGAADDQADILAVDLYLDADSSGTVNAGDSLLASSTYPGDEQPVGFSNPAGLIPGDIPSGGSRDLLVRYQLSGQAFQSETFQAQVGLGDLTVIGASSGLTLTPGGSPVIGSTMSVRRARLSVSTGPQNPGDSDALAGQPNVATLQVRVDVGPGEDVDLTSLTVRGAGTANETSDIANATLYLDRGTTLGAVDAGDLMLGTAQVYAADDGFVTFSAAALTSLTAGTDHRLLVAYQISVTSNTPRAFTARTGGAADVAGTGRSSALSAQTLGGTVTGGTKTIRRGSVAVAAGANMPAATPVFPNAQNLSLLQLALTAGFPESVQVNSVRVVASGTADEAQAVTRLKLVLDSNGDGFAAASDPVLGTSAIANDGAVTFALPATPAAGSLVVPAGQTRNLLLVYDLSGLAVPPGDLRLALAAPGDISTTGLTSLQPIVPSGATITGNQIPLQLGTLALSLTAANPAASNVLRNARDLAVLQLRCDTGSVESVKVNSVRLTHTGTGNPASAVSIARLYFDQNANGVLDADTQLATTTFSGSSATFTIPGGFDIASVDSSHFLVLYELNNSPTAGQTFQLSLAANADLSASGNSSGLPIPPSGAPLSGGVKTVVQATLGLAAGAQSPTNRSVFRDEQDVAVLQLRLSAGPAEPVEVTSVRVTPNGTGNSATQISRVRLYLEGDPADGVLNGDQLVGDFANYGGGALTIAPTTSVTVPAGGAKSLLLIVDHNAPASSAGATFGAQVLSNSDIVARGVSSTDPVAPSGVPPAVGAQHTIREASLTLSQGDAPVGAGTIAIVQTGVAVLQAKLSAGSAEAVSVTSLSLTFQGSANPQTAITAVRLFRDQNDNGVLDGDPLLATQTYSGAGTLTFSLANGALVVPAAGFRHVLVAYDVGGTTSDLQTFSVRVASAADVSGVGQSSGLNVGSGGTFPLDGAIKTARERTLSIQAGLTVPDQDVFINQVAVRALTLTCTAGAGEGIRITGITLRGDPAGTGNDTGIAVRLYRDQNADGVLDAGDTFLGTQTFAGDPGVAAYTISPSLDVVPAGSVSLLAVYDLPGTAPDATTFRLRFAGTADITAVGATSGATATFIGGPFPLAGPLLTARRSTLTLSAPTQVAAGQIVRNAPAQPMVRVRASASGVEDVKLTSLTVRPDPAATGNATQAQVRLFQDLNNNGTLEVSDVQLGVTQAGSATSVSFVNATGLLSVPAGSSQDLLVVWDYNGAPTPGQTFTARVNSGDVAAIGSSSGAVIVVSGGPFVGGTQTVTDPALAIAAGPNFPTAGVIFPNTSNVPTLTLRLSAGSVETVRVTQVSIAAIGSGNDATDLSGVRLYRDDNSNGLLDGDTLLASATSFPSDDGTLAFAIPAGLLDIPSNSSRDLLLVYDFGPGATPTEAYQARLAAATDVVAQGLVSLIAAARSGAAQTGGLKTIAIGSLSASAGPANPPAGSRLRNARTVPQLQVSLSAGSVEAVRLTQVVFRASGSGDDVADVTSAALYLDDGDGLVSASDTLLQGGVAYSADDGTLSFSGLTQVIPAGASRTLVVAYDYAAASAGGTYTARLQSPAADLSLVGVGSGATIVATGPTITGGATTLVEASLAVAAGPGNPAASAIQQGASAVEVLQLRFSAGAAESVRVTQVRLTPSGTGHDANGIAQVALYQDLNGNGLLDGDTLLASGTWPADDAGTNFPLTLSVPASGTVDLLAVVNVAAVVTASDTFTTRLALNGDVTAQGLVSGLSVTTSGAPVAGGAKTIAIGSLNAAAGPSNPGPSNRLRNARSVPQLQVRLSAGSVESVRVTQLVVRASGSGSDVADISSAALYLDDGDGVVSGGDTLLQSGGVYAGDDGTLTFSGLTQVVPAGASRDLLVVYDYAAASAGGTFAARLQDPSADLSAVGVTSGAAISVAGGLVSGGLTTLVQTSLSAALGPANPAAASVQPGTSNLPVLQVRFSAGAAESARITQVRLTPSGTGNDATGITQVALYRDLNSNGVLDGDPLLASGTWPGDDTPATFALTLDVPASGTVDLLAVVNVAAVATASHTFTTTLALNSDVTAQGQISGLSVATSGAPVAGGTQTIAIGTLSAAAGPNNPGPSNRLRNARGVAQLQLRLSAGAAESVRVTQLVVRASGSGNDVADVSSAALYLDDGDGLVSGGDTLLQSGGVYAADDGALTFSGLTQVVPAGATRDLLLVYDYAAASAGGTFAARLQSPSADLSAVGVTSGALISASGGTVTGGLTSLVETSLSVAAGPNNPAAASVLPGATSVAVLQARFSAGAAESARITQVRLTPSGTGNDATGITQVALYRDLNSNGVLDGDALLASGTWPGDDAPATFALTLDVPASGNVDLLAVINVAAVATGSQTFTTTLALNADVTAQGLVSGLSVAPSGAPVAGGTQTIAVGTLSAVAGPNNPGPSNRLRNARGVAQLQVRLSAGPAESVRVTQLVVRASGSGNDVADVSSAALYLDDGDGVVSGGDTLLQSGGVYAGDDGALTFGGLTQVLPPGTSRDLLVVYDYAAASAGGTFAARLQDPSVDLSAVGVTSGVALSPSGGLIGGGLTSLVETSLSVAAGPANPAAANVQRGASAVPVLQLRFSAGAAESARITQLRLTPSGTGNDATGITQVALYRDLNSNGVLDGDTLLASGTWPGDDTPLAFALTLDVPASSTLDLLAVVNVAAVTTLGQTFTTALAFNADVTAQGQSSGLSVATSGAPVAGGTQTVVATAAIAVSQSVSLPAGTATASSESVLLPVRLSETTGLAGVRLQSLVVSGSGSGNEASDISFVRLYRDLGAPGVRDGADVQIGLSAFFSDDGLASFAGLNELVPASGSLDLLVSYVFADGSQATSGETFVATVQVGGLTLVEVGSGQTITPSGLPQVGPQRTILAPTITAAAGPNNPGAVAASPGEADVELLQFTLSANEAGGGTITGITISAIGSGNDATGIAAASLYVDQDGDGVVGSGDRLLQRLSTPFVADNGTAAFSVSESLATSSSVTWLVAYELASGVSATQGFGVSLSAVSAGAVTISGLPVTGGTIVGAGTLRLSLGGAPPRRVLAIPSSGEAAALIRLSADGAEAWTLSSLRLTASGTADDLGDVGNLSLFLDDGDGVYEPGADDGAALASAPFTSDDGQALLGSLALSVPAGGSRDLWVALDVSGAATAGRSFRVSLMDGSLVGASGDVSGSTRILGGRVDGAALDLGVSSSLFLGSSTAALGSAEVVAHVATADLDRDGDQDFVALRGDGRLEVRLNTGAGAAFSLKGTFVGGAPVSPQRVLIGDLDRDGWPDVVVVYAASVTVFTNQGAGDPGNLNAAVDYADAGADYREAVLIDYQRDGDLDLVLIDRAAPRLRGRRNDGAGGLSAVDALALPALPRRLCAGDFDRDGRLDLAWSDDAGQVRTARGSGAFFVLDDADAGAVAGAMAALDLDLDGDLDLLAVDAAGNALLPFANAGGAFSPAASQASAPGLTQTLPGDLAAADLDGNGVVDLLLPHAGTDGLVARVVSASLSFPSGDASAYAAGADPDRVASADFNGDGDPDALVASTSVAGQVEVLLGDGQTKGSLASLSSASVLVTSDFARALASADLDRDGRPDLIVAGQTKLGVVLRPSALGYAAVAETSLAGEAGGLAVGDLDRDGALDLVVTIKSLTQDRIEVYRGGGDGTLSGPFSALTSGDTNPGPVTLFDKDRDGVLDAVVGESAGIQLYRGNGVSLGNALGADAYATPSAPVAVLAADLNRDGRADVAAVCSNGTLEVRLGGAGFSLGSATSTPLAAAIGTPSGAVLADLDRDGRLDLIVAGSGGLEVLQGDGAGGFTSQLVSTLQAGLTGVAALDLDKDGDLDLLAPHATGWALYVSAGGFSFAAPVNQPAAAGAGLRGVVVVDLDVDGDLDAAFGSTRRELQHALGR